MKKLTILIIVILVALGAWMFLSGSNEPGAGGPVEITYPAGGETLVQGEAYALTWEGGPAETQIFLVDVALKAEGASVSVSDRVYGIENTGSYQYVIPRGLTEGEYEFQIGDATSKTFRITATQAI